MECVNCKNKGWMEGILREGLAFCTKTCADEAYQSTIEFKSEPLFYMLEKEGKKPNTVRKIEEGDLRLEMLERGFPKIIRIKEALGNGYFDREITSVVYAPMFKLWIISWKHIEIEE